MKKKRQNQLDKWIENLAREFLKIPNFDFVHKDTSANQIFNFIVRKYAELNDFKTLFLNYFLPASGKAIVDAKKQINSSIYKAFLIPHTEELKENYNEIIRLGYVGLFHKLENFIDQLIKLVDTHFQADEDSPTNLEKYLKDKFDYRLKDWKANPLIERLNWICICIKHYDSYPIKEPRPRLIESFPMHIKIVLSKESFRRDIDFMIEYYELLIKQVFNFALYKFHDEMFEQVDESIRNNLDEDLAKKKKALDDNMENMIKLLKDSNAT